ncbi:transketolase [Gammaproteobacteria bacterium]|nr:transketolase [Gammaproteobacteria bacterium]
MKNTLIAKKIRRNILEMAFSGSTVHLGCALCLVEIFAVIYRNHLNYDYFNSSDPARDFLVLSKGHGVMAQYACMRELGWLKHETLLNYFADGTDLKGLSDSRVQGLEVTSGSLGHGLSVGVGIAFGHKIKNVSQKTFIIVGDGELNEGACWEAIQFAGHHQLHDLLIIVDKNNFQAMDETSKIINQDNLNKQIESFHFNVMEVDGHDELELDNAINSLFELRNKRPHCIIANTIKGKGVSFMENKNEWHYLRLDQDLYDAALIELEI